MDTVFAMLLWGQYFRIHGEPQVYRKMGDRTAWAFRGYCWDQVVYIGRPGPTDLSFRPEEQVTPCRPPSPRAARY